MSEFRDRVRPGDVVLGADTACVMGRQMYGTPRNEHEAAEMINPFSGGVHEVVTGVALVDPFTGARELLADAATVRMGRLSPAQVDEYVKSGLWSGKAGGYNLEERVAAGWPIEVAGDPTTVVGLPMKLLLKRLDRRARAAQTPA